MAMGTRSKAREETTAVSGKQERETGQGTDKVQKIPQRSESVRTDLTEVKIKKELIEENLPAGLTETAAFPDDPEVAIVNKGQDKYSSNRKASGSLQTTRSKWNKTHVLGDRRSLVPAHGKRRLPAVSSRKRNRKYFQDIRAYAKSFRLAQNQDKSITAPQGELTVDGDNPLQAGSSFESSTLQSPTKNIVREQLNQGEITVPNTDDDESGSESELSDTGSDSDSSDYSAAFEVDDSDVSFETSDEEIQEDGSSKGRRKDRHDKQNSSVDRRNNGTKPSTYVSSQREPENMNQQHDQSSGMSGEPLSHHQRTEAERARESLEDNHFKSNETIDRDMEDVHSSHSPTHAEKNTSSFNSGNSKMRGKVHTHSCRSDTVRTSEPANVTSKHLVDLQTRDTVELHGTYASSKQAEQNTSSLNSERTEVSGKSHPHHRSSATDDCTRDSTKATCEPQNESNDSEMEDVQFLSSSMNIAQSLEGSKRVRTPAKVTFDGATKDTSQSSLRRHKKNHKSDDNSKAAEMNSSAPTIPLPLKAKFTVIAKSCATIEQQMKLRGLKMVEEKQLWETPVKLEFNIDRNLVEYNVRAQLLALLQLLKAKDPTLKIKSATTNEKMWSQLDTLPEDEEFTENFQIKDFLYRKMRKVVVYMTLLTSIHVNQLKYTEKIKEHIFQNNIWLKPDRFQTKVESSPGVMIMVHPKLTNRLQLTEDLKLLMQRTAKSLNLRSTKEDKEHSDISKRNGDVYRQVPQFYLELSVKKWGNLRVEVIRINCAKDDAEYIKYLLSSSGEQGSLQKAVFLPEGLHLMEGKELVYNMLQEHDQFTREVTGVPISGITYKDLSSVVPKNSKTIKEIIMNIPGVISIEQTRDRAVAGNLMVITKKSAEQSVVEKLSQKMEMFYACQTGQTRIIMAGRQKIPYPGEESNSVKTYAEILSARYQSSEREIPPKQKASQSKVNQQSQGVPVKINEERQRPQPMQSTSSVTRQLEKKMEKMFAAQERIEQAQIKLQQEHNELKKVDKTINERADNNIQEDKLHQMMDKKLAEFKEEHTKRTEEHNAALRSEIGRSFDRKMDKISITVAQQVTSQLVELFHQYMSPKKQIESNRQNRDKDTPLITQESFNSPPEKQLQQVTNGITQGETSSPGDTSMFQALNAIETTSPIQRSPHDNFSERMNTS